MLYGVRAVVGGAVAIAVLAGRQRVADRDGDRGALRGVPSGVAEQVSEHLVQPVLVAADLHRVVGELEHPAVVGPRDLGVARRLDRQPRHVHRIGVQRASGVQPGEQQQVVDEHAHPGGFRQHPAERVGDGFRGVARVQQAQLGVAADGGERGAQLVAGVGGEPAQPRLAGRAPPQRGLDVPEHAVERQPELAGLGARIGVRHAPGHRDLAGLERQLGHPGRGGGDPAQRPQRQPDPPGAEHPGEHQDAAEDPDFRQRDVLEQVVDAAQRQAGDVGRPVGSATTVSS